jgi:hypothetical protein
MGVGRLERNHGCCRSSRRCSVGKLKVKRASDLAFKSRCKGILLRWELLLVASVVELALKW